MGFRTYLGMLRISHTAFSLPFAYVGALAAGLRDPLDAVMIGVALFSARSVAILSNDLFDRELDAYNPRTSRRPLVTGEADPSVVTLLIVFFSLTFSLTALYFNWLAFFLSFPILVAEVSYPFAKRVHCFPHLHLGAILGASPLAGAIAISGSLEELPWGYSIALALWVAGFDVIYSLQDVEFDRRFGVKSIPACFNETIALNSASVMHVLSFLVLLSTSAIGLISTISIISYGFLLLIENFKARRGEYEGAFDLNIAIGLLLGLGIMLEYILE